MHGWRRDWNCFPRKKGEREGGRREKRAEGAPVNPVRVAFQIRNALAINCDKKGISGISRERHIYIYIYIPRILTTTRDGHWTTRHAVIVGGAAPGFTASNGRNNAIHFTHNNPRKDCFINCSRSYKILQRRFMNILRDVIYSVTSISGGSTTYCYKSKEVTSSLTDFFTSKGEIFICARCNCPHVLIGNKNRP